MYPKKGPFHKECCLSTIILQCAMLVFAKGIIGFSFQGTDRWSKVPKEHPTIDAAQPTDFQSMSSHRLALVSRCWFRGRRREFSGNLRIVGVILGKRAETKSFRKRYRNPQKSCIFEELLQPFLFKSYRRNLHALGSKKECMNNGTSPLASGVLCVEFLGKCGSNSNPKFRAESMDMFTYIWTLENGHMNQGKYCRKHLGNDTRL